MANDVSATTPDLDDPAHAARVRISARALGEALEGETYEQRARAVLALAEALRVRVSVFSSKPCESVKCESEALLRVHWPGQTRDLCRACTDRAIRVSQTMGFSLSVGPVS